ncbi:MAG: 1-acyl-sn-glycerol-3-phosphate acyltransferase [Treponema sp.]|nr:1-acyl-sn-glycerol-3-phosphate acyltransferase [Treponema sp.]
MRQLRFKFSIIKTLIPVLLHYIPKAEYYLAHPQKYDTKKKYKLAQDIVKLERIASRTKNKVLGLENLPKDGGYIMYANHQGKYDALGVVSSHPRPFSILWAKKSSQAILAKQESKLLNCEIIDLDNKSTFIGSIKNIANAVKKGIPFLIFPEGKYDNNKNNLQSFHTGCFMASLLSKAPIVPVALYDSYKAMDTNNIFKRETVQIHYLKPINYEEYKDLNRRELAELVKTKIQIKINEINMEVSK